LSNFGTKEKLMPKSNAKLDKSKTPNKNKKIGSHSYFLSLILLMYL
jgi:hypothetical protein